MTGAAAAARAAVCAWLLVSRGGLRQSGAVTCGQEHLAAGDEEQVVL